MKSLAVSVIGAARLARGGPDLPVGASTRPPHIHSTSLFVHIPTLAHRTGSAITS